MFRTKDVIVDKGVWTRTHGSHRSRVLGAPPAQAPEGGKHRNRGRETSAPIQASRPHGTQLPRGPETTTLREREGAYGGEMRVRMPHFIETFCYSNLEQMNL
jgi:hypothetical protein